MRLEFTHTPADLREAVIPERYASNPGHYRARMWVGRASIALILAFLIIQLLPGDSDRSVTFSRKGDDLLMEILPCALPAIYLVLLYGMALWRAWRKSIDWSPAGEPAKPGNRALLVLVRLSLWAGVSGCVYIAITPHAPLIWNPSRIELMLIRGGPCFVLLFLALFLGFLQRATAARTQWRTHPAWRRSRTVTLDASGYTNADELSTVFVAWPGFARARETTNLFILITLDGMQCLISKRAFVGPSDVQTCRAMLQNGIKNTQFLTVPGGFAVLPIPT